MEEKRKKIECIIDSADMYQWKQERTTKKSSEYFYDEEKCRSGKREEEIIPVNFEIEHTYQVFDCFDWYWGNFNKCPDCRTMKSKAKEWYEKYEAELVQISHDTLTFQCRKLSETEAKEILAEASELHAEIIDCKTEDLVSYMTKYGRFTLWWD
ncbi:MAG: DUF4253 domain-containing protein [Lachnospiraceae bacterium]